MRRLAAVLFCMILLCAAPVPAQNEASPQQESSSAPGAAQKRAPEYDTHATPRFEISAGYSYRAYSPTASTTLKLNGGYFSAEYNIFSWVGVAAEGTAAVRRQGAQSLGTAQRLSIFSGAVGPQVYPLRHKRVTVFTHVLFGESYYYSHAPAFGGFAAKNITSSGMAWEVGGGLDARVAKHWSIRLIEGDYGGTAFSVPGADPHQVAYRLSGGMVYLIGQK